MASYLVVLPKTNVFHIDPASGVVAAEKDGTVHVYFESNRYGACNLHQYEERVLCAAGRLHEKYPTIARCWVPKEHFDEHFEVVGKWEYDSSTLQIEPDKQAAVDEWVAQYSGS